MAYRPRARHLVSPSRLQKAESKAVKHASTRKEVKRALKEVPQSTAKIADMPSSMPQPKVTKLAENTVLQLGCTQASSSEFARFDFHENSRFNAVCALTPNVEVSISRIFLVAVVYSGARLCKCFRT